MQQSTAADEALSSPLPIIDGCHILFDHEGREYGGTISNISAGGYGEVTGFGFTAKGVHASTCTLNSLFPYPNPLILHAIFWSTLQCQKQKQTQVL